jgi:hypothetical protein
MSSVEELLTFFIFIISTIFIIMALWNCVKSAHAKSVDISECLDTLGLSTEMVAMRILSTVYNNNILNTRKEQFGFITIPSGSVIEGIGLQYNPAQYYPAHLASDVDTMYCFTDIVFHDGEVGPHPSRNKMHCVTRPAPHHGFLYIFYKDKNTLLPTDVQWNSADVHDFLGYPQYTRHGPAHQDVEDTYDNDNVVCG